MEKGIPAAPFNPPGAKPKSAERPAAPPSLSESFPKGSKGAAAKVKKYLDKLDAYRADKILSR
jgi:hypothetical protein